MPIKRDLEYHELSEKKNLVTLQDNRGTYDKFVCINCNKEFRMYSLVRSERQPGHCYVSQAKYDEVMERRATQSAGTVTGAWISPTADHKCSKCDAAMVECPREGHPNSKYWDLERGDGMKLFVCSNNCPEDGE